MTVYARQWRDITERTAMRRWVGRTRGVSIERTVDDCIEHGNEPNVRLTYIRGYLISVKNERAEMLLLLQYPDAIKIRQ